MADTSPNTHSTPQGGRAPGAGRRGGRRRGGRSRGRHGGRGGGKPAGPASQPTRQGTRAPRSGTKPAPPQAKAAPPEAPEPRPFTSGVFSILIPPLQRALSEQNYHTPTPIQEASIGHILDRRDIFGCAQTGTGKTAAFMLPILQNLVRDRMRRTPGAPLVLIVTPTRELAAQIDASIGAYGRFVDIRHAVIFGGVGQKPQVDKLVRGLDVLVATPGRLLDLMGQGHIRLDCIEVFVLDEADRMLDMGFIHDVRRIIRELPERRQSLFFSATLPKPVVALAETLVNDPVHVSVSPGEPTVEKIVQRMYFLEKKDKDDMLLWLMQDTRLSKVLVFTRMKHMANKVAKKLESGGISAAAIHGNKSQTARTAALEDFKKGRVRVLVATDIAARGIDVERISHVVNYDLPSEPETYIHRIGRTARATLGGDAISMCAAEERDQLRDIERLIHRQVPVITEHPYHSERARNATGADARAAPKKARGQRKGRETGDGGGQGGKRGDVRGRPKRGGGHDGGRRGRQMGGGGRRGR